MVEERIVTVYERTEKPNESLPHGSMPKNSVRESLDTVALVVNAGCVASLYNAPCTSCSCSVKSINGAVLSADHGTGFAHHRSGSDDVCHSISYAERSTCDGCTSTADVPGPRNT